MANRYQYDYLVLGSGIAGLWFALGVADHGQVAIITKKETADQTRIMPREELRESGTRMIQLKAIFTTLLSLVQGFATRI